MMSDLDGLDLNPDLDALDALDWHHETPCTVVVCAASRPPARWRIVMACACVVLACDPCKANLDDDLEHADTLDRVQCRTCDVILPRTFVVAIEPLA